MRVNSDSFLEEMAEKGEHFIFVFTDLEWALALREFVTTGLERELTIEDFGMLWQPQQEVHVYWVKRALVVKGELEARLGTRIKTAAVELASIPREYQVDPLPEPTTSVIGHA